MNERLDLILPDPLDQTQWIIVLHWCVGCQDYTHPTWRRAKRTCECGTDLDADYCHECGQADCTCEADEG